MKIETSDLNLLSQKIKVETAVQAGTRTLYRNLIPIRFDSHPLADRIDITDGLAVLKGNFKEKNYNVLESDSPLTVNFEEGENKALIVTLDKPYVIGQIGLKQKTYETLSEVMAAIDIGLFDGFYLHQIQGSLSVGAAQTQATQYTDSVQSLREAAQLDYISGALWTLDFSKIELFRVDGNNVIDAASDSVDNGTGSENFIADRFAIKVRDQYAKYIHFDQNDLSTLNVRSLPLGPRLAISTTSIEDLQSSDYFWSFPGEIDNTEIDQQELSEKWKNALQQHFDRLVFGKIKAENYIANLVIESDKPCEFDLDELNIAYHLVKNKDVLVSDQGETKNRLSLNFDGTALQTKAFELSIPSDVHIKRLKLKTDNSFRGEYMAPLTRDINAFEFDEAKRIRVDDTRWIAQSIQLEKAQPVNCIAVALTGLEEGTECSLEIQGGSVTGPSGHKLAEGTISVKCNNKTVWYTLNLRETLTLYTETYWLLLKCKKGSLLWNASQQENGASVLVLNRKNGARKLDRITCIKDHLGHIALFRKLSVTDAQTDQWPVKFVHKKAYVENDLHLHVVAGEQAETWVDLTAKTNAALMESTSLVGVSVVGWEVASLQKGLLTVYEPEVEFEI